VTARVHRQRAFFVRKEGSTHLAVFTVWSAGDHRSDRYGQLDLVKPVRALVPSSALGVSVVRSVRGLTPEAVPTWLARHGYVVLDEMAVDVDEPLGRF